MLASPNLDIGRPPVSRVAGYACQRFPVETQQVRWTELEWLTFRIDESLDHSNNSVELTKAVQSFLASSEFWVRDYLCVERTAVTSPFVHHLL